MEKLKKEFQYYLDHQDELVKQYNGRYLVIMGEKVVGDYPTKLEAYHDAVKKFGLGNFIIQLCSPGNKDYTVTFHTHRVAFKR
ncbi:MAG: hypothetical protein FJY10_07840 [Bacteroidetes bacterium]|nr:hypothetical protein [Bacteroidota bacterium]